MNNLVQKFIFENIKKCREILNTYHEKTGNSHLQVVGKEKDAPLEVVFARAQLDAFVRVGNFIGDNPPRVEGHMPNSEAIRTASELFFNEVNEEEFDWINGPKTEEEASELINKHCDGRGIAKGFNAVLYYWYNFERTKKEKEKT